MEAFKQKLKQLKSMRVSFLLLLIFVTGAALAAVTVGTVIGCRRQAVDSRIAEVSDYGKALANQMSAAGYMAAQGQEITSEILTAADIFSGRIIVVDNNLRVVTDTYNYEVGKTLLSKSVIECIRGVSSSYVEQGKDYVELTIPVTQSTVKENAGAVIVRASLTKENAIATRVET